MNLHQAVAAEISSVFLNLDEFASLHEIEGKTLPCVVNESEAGFETGASDGFANISGIGVLKASRVVCLKAADLEPAPLPGQRISMDSQPWLVGDGVSVCEGLLTLPLERAF